MAEPKSNVGSASHLGENQVVRDSHFIFDYANRRVPLPIVSYLAVADASGDLPPGESPSKRALEMLRDLIEPAVIAEEELHTEQMEGLIRGALAEINNRLGPNVQAQPPTPGAQVSLTMVIADAGRAYIGHIGTSKIYLLHDDRLFDLVPSGAVPVPGASGPSTEAPALFAGPTGEPEGAVPPQPMQELAQPPIPELAQPPIPGVVPPQPPVPGVVLPQPPMPVPGVAPPPVPPVAATGAFLGQAPQANIGFNQVDIGPDDVIILCTDGLWKTVSDEELVENLLSTASVQRSASQLTRVAFSRDASDNATMVVWKYGTEADLKAADGALRPMKVVRSRAAEALLVALLALVLVGIFAVGFAFGWRITDTFRKPAKEAAQKARAKAQAQKAQQSQPQTQPSGAESAQTQGSQPAAAGFPKNATVKGQGVRMRATPDTTGQLVGQLSNGQQVSVVSEAAGSDSKTWAKIKATITSGGQQVQSEGYVRSDFLTISK